MKLRQDAVGVVTIGPNLCKDKLMQGCGRLRQLDKGQSIKFVGTKEVTTSILVEVSPNKKSDLVTSKDLVQWTLKNNILTISEGLIVWAQQGNYFCFTKFSPKFALEQDDCSLKCLFGSSIQIQH
jgi:hypothetical protein